LLAQAFLNAQILRRGGEGRRRLTLEHVGYALLLGVGRLLTSGQTVEERSVLVLEIVVDLGDFAPARIAVAGQMHHLVNAIHLVAVVNDEIALAISGENVHPEFDVGLDYRRSWEWEFRAGDSS